MQRKQQKPEFTLPEMRRAAGFDTKSERYKLTGHVPRDVEQIRSQQQRFCPKLSTMNASEDNLTNYVDIYDYEPDCNQESRFVVLPVFYYVLFCLGLIGNTTVLWVLLRYIKLRTMTDVCLLNLVVSDFMVAVSLPLWVIDSQNLASCKLIAGVYQLGFYSGTLFVTLMSVDRYLAIVHAVAAMRTRTRRYGIIVSLTIWVVSIVLATPQVVFASLELDNENDSSECHPVYPEESQKFWKLRRNFTENSVGLFVCLPIMVFCYTKILVVLAKSRNSKKDKAVRLIFTVVCVFVVCWVPYNVTVLLDTLELVEVLSGCEASTAVGIAMGFTEMVALSHCCVNPVIYAFIGEKFRKSLGKVLRKCLHHSQQGRWASSYRDTTDRETSNTPVKSDY